MPRKGENIRKRKDRRWEARYKNGFNSDGSVKYTSVYAKSYTEVKNKLSTSKSNACLMNSRISPTTTVEEILRLWFKSKQINLKGSTQKKYSYLIEKHILPFFENIKVSDVNGVVVNEFIYKKINDGRLHIGGNLSPTYVKTMLIIIEAAFKYGSDLGLCSVLNGNTIVKPKIIKAELNIFDIQSQKKFEALAVKHINETVTGIYIALYSGLRIGEVCALNWADVDFENRIIHVRHTVAYVTENAEENVKPNYILDTPKTKSSVRDIPISSVLIPVLTNMKKRRKSDFVVSTTNNFINTRTFEYRYKSVLKKFGLPIVNFHTFRHTFATRCVESGMDIKSLSKILGHSSVAITLNTYVHPSMETMREQMTKLII